jgi:glycosyltransferase involved in cell wall biosynthesis
MPSPAVTVILSAYNPDPGRLARTLAGLRAQTLPVADWELVLIDNASEPPVALLPGVLGQVRTRLVREELPGLSFARRRGIAEATGSLCVLVDDDNVLAPTYLAAVVRLFDAHREVAAMGGPSRPEFSAPAPAWTHEFFPLLALRDLGATPQIVRTGAGATADYPACAPIGAGMALRLSAARAWSLDRENAPLSDRTGTNLTSGGDNDIVLHVCRAGGAVAYFPELELTHLIPSSRLEPAYLARLNRGIQRSWVRVLALYGVCPWRPVPGWTLPLRLARAWARTRAWRGPVEAIRFAGLRGRLEGQADLPFVA